eukprot:CAMPEP_0114156688 /NCGR_PEP_ID=MMETSP0043_2-20121206/26194_1 /TAXON_ID=464988 /ORGANISM="Hemiselmis andersenii, Strain CCMP644" /LENGTH=61 /DNA_ID=CAMNT_0001252151 /DNA_START=75 /DNA_END=260 /DNA_ORIENTATION=-
MTPYSGWCMLDSEVATHSERRRSSFIGTVRAMACEKTRRSCTEGTPFGAGDCRRWNGKGAL